MAKFPTFDTILAAFASASKLNANFDEIVTSFTNTVSRDGSTPNEMNADFDMNSFDILNVGDLFALDIIIDGLSLEAQIDAAAASAVEAGLSEIAAAASAAAAAISAATAATLTEFVTLTDTPADYSGDGSKFVKVNAGATALEFVAGSASEPSDGDKGDITVSGGSGLVWNIDASAVDATALAANAVETAKILDDNVTYAKIQDVVADDVVLGRISGAGGVIEEITTTQLTVLIDEFTDALSGAVPASGGGTTKFLRADQTWVAPTSGARNLLHIQDQQSDGSNGGSFSSGAWRTRTLNTAVTNDISGASLAANQITLPAGTFFIEARTPALEVKSHQARLRNISDTATELVGTSETCGGTVDTVTPSIVRGQFTIAGAKIFEIQHICETTKTTDGFGRAGSFGVGEVYTDVLIWEIV